MQPMRGDGPDSSVVDRRRSATDVIDLHKDWRP